MQYRDTIDFCGIMQMVRIKFIRLLESIPRTHLSLARFLPAFALLLAPPNADAAISCILPVSKKDETWRINTIVSANGQIMIGAEKGLFVLSHDTVRKIDRPDIPVTGVEFIHEVDHRVLIGTWNGLLFLDQNELLTPMDPNRFNTGGINSINGVDGHILIGGDNGLYALRDNDLDEITSQDGSRIPGVAAIVEVPGRVLIGTWNGLYILSNWKLKLIPNSDISRLGSIIKIETAGSEIMVVSNNGVFRLVGDELNLMQTLPTGDKAFDASNFAIAISGGKIYVSATAPFVLESDDFKLISGALPPPPFGSVIDAGERPLFGGPGLFTFDGANLLGVPNGNVETIGAVRVIDNVDNHIFIGSENGLMLFKQDLGTLQNIPGNAKNVYKIFKVEDKLFVAADGLFRVETTPLYQMDLQWSSDLSKLPPSKDFRTVEVNIHHPCAALASKLPLKLRVISTEDHSLGNHQLRDINSYDVKSSDNANIRFLAIFEKKGHYRLQIVNQNDTGETEIGRSREFETYSFISNWWIISLSIAPFFIWSFSWRTRRFILLILGRRWTFRTGVPNIVADVTDENGNRRIIIKQADVGRSANYRKDLPNQWPLPTNVVQSLRTQIGSGAKVLVRVDESSFALPWSISIAGSWTDDRRNIAGQICLTDRPQSSPVPGKRLLTFSGLAFSHGVGGLGALPMAGPEVIALGERFKRWGGRALIREDNASTDDLVEALRGSDVVHVAAHAASDRIFLADGAFTTEHLSALDLSRCRCKLLILSACEAGSLDSPTAMLWQLVHAGVNVIAARRPVHDHICRIFFGELYTALLPRRNVTGIELAQAIRAAVDNSRSRLLKIPDLLDSSLVNRSFEETVGSFLLFGDPTLSLQLINTKRIY